MHASSPLNREQSREVDRVAVEKLGFASLVLMENAGRGCVEVLEKQGIAGPVAVLCGQGNNGGDGFVIARHLLIRGYEVRVLLVPQVDKLEGDALVNYKLLKQAKVAITPIASKGGTTPLGEILASSAAACDWLVDALLGTGAKGDPRPPYGAIINWMNADPAKKLAVDIPSGLDCDTGEPSAATVRASVTATFFSSKVGFDKPPAREFLGDLHVVDIGIPPRMVEDALQK